MTLTKTILSYSLTGGVFGKKSTHGFTEYLEIENSDARSVKLDTFRSNRFSHGEKEGLLETATRLVSENI